MRELLEPVAAFLDGRKLDGDTVTVDWMLSEFTLLELVEIAAGLTKIPGEGLLTPPDETPPRRVAESLS